MDRNLESHFSSLPSIDIERSTFKIPFSHKFTGQIGDVIPFYWKSVLPGDTFNITTSLVCRLQTLLTPLMDNLYIDTYYFYCKNFVLWPHWKEFCGENTDSAWIPQTKYRVPEVKSPENGWDVGTIADYLGIPPGVVFDGEVDEVVPNALPFRMYATVMDQFFRDQNVSDPLSIPTGDAAVVGSNGDNYITDVALGGKPFKAAKFHDLFSSCLPSPQKGESVTLGGIDAFAPVVTRSSAAWSPDVSKDPGLVLNGLTNTGSSRGNKYVKTSNVNTSPTGSDVLQFYGAATEPFVTGSSSAVYPLNLWADMSSGLDQISINDLRLAFQLQKFYERCARSGTRYREVLKSHFGVTAEDATMYIPEYLGGHRIPVSIHQVENTGETSTAFLGDLGAMSNTVDVHEDFTKSFTSHGIVMGFLVLRYDHSYSQGLEREWTKKDLLDYYFPVFNSIGEQPIYAYQIDATKRNGENRTDVFGYNEAWSEYRYGCPNRVSGEMRPGIPNSLANWHLADYYESQPHLSDSWVREDKNNVDRVLAVSSSVSHQFFCDVFVENIATRPMPMYSIPGLIDHF